MIQFSGDVSFMIVQTRIVPLHTHQGNQNTDKWLLLSGFKIWNVLHYISFLFSVELTLLIVRPQKVTTIQVMSDLWYSDNVLDFFSKFQAL